MFSASNFLGVKASNSSFYTQCNEFVLRKSEYWSCGDQYDVVINGTVAKSEQGYTLTPVHFFLYFPDKSVFSSEKYEIAGRTLICLEDTAEAFALQFPETVFPIVISFLSTIDSGTVNDFDVTMTATQRGKGLNLEVPSLFLADKEALSPLLRGYNVPALFQEKEMISLH